MYPNTESPTYRISRAEVATWLEAMLRDGKRVVAPVERRGMRVLRVIENAAKASIAPGKSRWSPKEFLFPRTETLFSYELKDGEVELTDPEPMSTDQVIFGVRPCDAAGLVRLDGVLMDDSFYAQRRARTAIVSMGCESSEPACFCTAVGGSPAGDEGADVLLAPVDGAWLVRTITPKGEALVAPHKGSWPAAKEEDWKAARALAEKVRDGIHRPEILPAWAEALEKSFADPTWTELAERCVGCSICAYVCPSCSCFDVTDQGTDSCGTRCRTWDSCSFRNFTNHASGHNPRPDQASRSRQRVLHKFAYYPLQHEGPAMCVGCGRCIEHCPVGMDIHEEVMTVMGACKEGPDAR